MKAVDYIVTEGYQGTLTAQAIRNMSRITHELRTKHGNLPVIFGAYVEGINAIYGYIFESPKWPCGHQIRTTSVMHREVIADNVYKVTTCNSDYIVFE